MTKLYLYVRRYLTCVFLFGAFFASGQERVVSGRVTASEDGTGLPGVNVVEKGTANGTVSDSDGNYKISVGSNAILVFSFVGYKSQEITTDDQASIDVKLVSDVATLNEVVVVGYGNQEKKDISAAVVSLKSESFNKGNLNDPSQLLLGKVAGVSVVKTGNDPNEPFTIRLRGITTVGANTQPLFVIDGVIGADYKALDPNDIVSFDVLKDGAAASIYGTRASSGVVLITTKKGKAGETHVDLNSYVAVENIAKSVPVLGREGYLAVGGKDLGSSTNWMKQITQAGVTNATNLAVSGGTGKTTYRAAFNFRDVNGVLKTSGWVQKNFRLDLQTKLLDDHVRLSFNASSTQRNSNYSFPQAMKYAVLYNPTAPVYAPGGANPITGSPYEEQALFDIYNPVAIINQNSNLGNLLTVNLSGKLDFDIVPVQGLTGVVSYAIQNQNETLNQYISRTSYYGGIQSLGGAPNASGTSYNNVGGFNTGGTIFNQNNVKTFGILEMYLAYAKQFGKLNLTAVGGYSYQKINTSGYGIIAGDFISDALGANQLQNSLYNQAGKNILSSYASPDQLILGFFGRANLSYNNTFFLNGTYRRDGASYFGPGNKWGNFGGLSGSVVVSNLTTIPGFDLLKVRASYGLTGALPPWYGLSQTQYGQTGGFGYNNGTITPIVSTTLAANPNLSWETKTEYNGGLDMAFLNNRLTASVDVYQRSAQNFIQYRPINASTNVAAYQYQNIGNIRTRGVELSIGYAVIQKSDFSWNTTLVGTHIRSILVSLNPGVDSSPNGLPELTSALGSPGQNNTFMIQDIAGQQVGTIYGPKYSGVAGDGTPILTGSGSIAAGTFVPQNSIIGHALPTFDGGWTNFFRYKNWDFNFFLRTTLGHNLINTFRAFYEPVISGQVVEYNRVDTKYYNPNLTTAQFSSYYVEKAGFLKLDNAQVGYNFKLKTALISKLRLYVSGNNLFVITKYTGVDPEARLVDYGDNGFTPGLQNLNQGSVLAPGIDRRNSYFRTRTFTVGVNFTF